MTEFQDFTCGDVLCSYSSVCITAADYSFSCLPADHYRVASLLLKIYQDYNDWISSAESQEAEMQTEAKAHTRAIIAEQKSIASRHNISDTADRTLDTFYYKHEDRPYSSNRHSSDRTDSGGVNDHSNGNRRKHIHWRRLEKLFYCLSWLSYSTAVIIFLSGVVFHSASAEDIISGVNERYLQLKYIELCVIFLVGLVLSTCADRAKGKAVKED